MWKQTLSETRHTPGHRKISRNLGNETRHFEYYIFVLVLNTYTATVVNKNIALMIRFWCVKSMRKYVMGISQQEQVQQYLINYGEMGMDE